MTKLVFGQYTTFRLGGLVILLTVCFVYFLKIVKVLFTILNLLSTVVLTTLVVVYL